MVRTSTLLPAGAAALCGAHLAFVQPAAPAQGEVAAPRLRAGAARASAQSGSFAGALPAASAVAIGSVVACRAAATKKKGVKVVHGKEIPWNIFMPKAPYTGKVVTWEMALNSQERLGPASYEPQELPVHPPAIPGRTPFV